MKRKKRNSNSKKFFIAGVLVVCIILIFSLYSQNKEEAVAHLNPIDTGVSQYSNKNITQNAIATNPEFKQISLGTIKERGAFSNQVASAFGSIKTFLAKFWVHKAPKEKEYGTWVWTPVKYITREYADSIISAAKKDNVNTIYVSIDSYLDIFVMKDGSDKKAQEKDFSERLEYFIGEANKVGIAVDAEAGWQNWAEEGNTYKAFAVLDYVKRFNETHQNKFRGFQYDVEPYLLASYKENPAPVLKNFMELVDLTEKFINTSTLSFSVVVPDFYDRKDKVTPRFSYDGSKDYAFAHILKILDRGKNNSIIIMSYRNFAEGKDGAIEISKNEMLTADKKAINTKIIIAQEIGNVPPPYITFYQTSKSRLQGEVGKINSVFNSYPSFGGVAYHYANALMALK